MSQLTIPVIQAFVDSGRGGNPAAVVLNADSYDRSTRQTIAAQVGLSETAFLSASSVADYKLEFFTPIRQIAQCGHATIAAFSYLAQQGLLNHVNTTMETVDGIRHVELEEDQAFMEQRAPTFTQPDSLLAELSNSRILDSLQLSADDVVGGLDPLVINTGNSFMIVPLKSAAAVRRAVPDQVVIDQISEQLGLVGFYIFSQEVEQPGHDAGSRMFAPHYGILEEAATGMAAGPLACYLYKFLHQKKTTYHLEQGYLMQPASPSVLTAQLQVDQGTITGLRVGGRASVSHSLTITF
ncbi:PhzF family phenazine biosynthesis protein [Spirosoma sp.]|uniref:PhzF family phenazine biosynthesis protein n=1 Tax=Spirosoma sp. TaxID=1899569 RepID=UPI003B3BAF6E